MFLGLWTRWKIRYCNDPEPKYGGNCPSEDGIANKTEEICDQINGGWSDEWEFESDENCELIGSAWLKEKFRKCNNPTPEYGGKYCENDTQGGNFTQVECNAIDGQWSDFDRWSKCNEYCRTVRYRKCSNPTPAFGGTDCSGNDYDYAFCTGDSCPMSECFRTFERGRNEIESFEVTIDGFLSR